MSKQMPSIGRIVHYVLGERSANSGEHRPAIIVRVWSATCVQLQVFTDADNDHLSNVEWRTSVSQDEDAKAGRTWHWPEYVPPVED